MKPWRDCPRMKTIPGYKLKLDMCDEAWLTREHPQDIVRHAPVGWCNDCDHWHIPSMPLTEVTHED